MRIGIDCRLAGKRHAGIGRYIENLVRRLPSQVASVTWVLFFHDQEQQSEILGNKSLKNVEVVLAPVKHYSMAEQLKMPGIFRRAKLDLLHIPHFNVPLLYRGKIVVTIHDLLWHEYRGAHVTTLSPVVYWLKYWVYRRVTAAAVKRARVIFVPAQTIKRVVSKYYSKVEKKIQVTKEGVGVQNLNNSNPIRRLADQIPTGQKTFSDLLYVGSLYPHKNIKVVVDALKQLPNFTLTLIGSRNVFQDQVKEYVRKQGVEKQVTFAGYVADEKLGDYYSLALALVQPSLSEGFGLTGVEALAAGVPVLASNIPIFNEIYKDAALYFDPHSADSFIKAVKKLQASDRKKVVNRGYKIAKEYSWDKMVQETWQGYQQALKA
ncbi:MAG TPA: glycosyltransferase family 1 protein [Vitreimonas sp.]|nr:glycosyltransferase family 1 protein [Vitreimonas sp.]